MVGNLSVNADRENPAQTVTFARHAYAPNRGTWKGRRTSTESSISGSSGRKPAPRPRQRRTNLRKTAGPGWLAQASVGRVSQRMPCRRRKWPGGTRHSCSGSLDKWGQIEAPDRSSFSGPTGASIPGTIVGPATEPLRKARLIHWSRRTSCTLTWRPGGISARRPLWVGALFVP
jgi:hypothetical protein